MRHVPFTRAAFLLLGLTLLGASPAVARAQQEATVRGTVTDSVSGQPVTGAQIMIAGQARATTNDRGAYLASVASGTLTVRVQRIGFAPAERQVTAAAGDTVRADFALHSVTVTLPQVLVVGYGTENRARVTGAVSTVNASDVQNQPVAGIDAALQGKAPGVQVIQNAGDPGNGITVRVRGAASVSASNQPLYVVDGVPVQTSDFSQLGPNGQGVTGVTGLDPSEIESITVLKDAASAAIYGSRASNGVVIITTKRGSAGATRFSFDANTGWQQPERYLSLMNAKQYVAFMNQGAENDGDSDPFTPGVDDAQSTDWQRAIFRSAPVGNLHLGLSGGSDRIRYSLGGSYFGQTGIVLGSSYSRVSGRANIDFDATPNFSVKTSLAYSKELDHRIPGDNSLTGVVTNAIGEASIYPVRAPNGQFAGNDQNLYYANPVAIADLNNLPTTTDRFLGNVEGTYRFIPSLSLTGRFGADVLTMNELEWDSPLVDGTYAAQARGVAKSGYSTGNQYTLEGFLTYSHENADAASLNIVGGASVQYNTDALNFVRAEGFSSDQFHYVRNGTVITSFDGLPSTNHNLESVFGRANYSWKDRYLLSASLRTDASSRFGPNNQWGLFPAIAGGWVISEEPFMGNFDEKFGKLKLRASYGVTGNQDFADFSYLGLYGTSNYGENPGIAPTSFANPNLKWETTHEFDGGVDWYPFGGRLTVIADYYHRLTSDLIVDRPIPATTGFATYWDNIGNVLNRGFELGLSSANFRSDDKNGFTWNTDFNISFNHNEVTALFENQPFGDGENFRPISRVAVGQPIGEFYVLHFKGVDPQTGDAMYQDVNGDGEITSDDRVDAGNPQPKFFGGLRNTWSWKGFSLGSFLEFSYGAKVFDLMRIFADDGGYNYDNKFTYAANAWTHPGQITNEPRASFDGTSGAREISDRFIEDGSYLRISEITLSWRIPETLMPVRSLQNTTLYVSGHNLHNFTKYTGYDPDVNSNGQTSNIALGTDYYAYPRARTFSIGLSTNW
ncbi:MAG TPA: TonB-dependent receptor [Gemmatimonadaceae bacterium]|nr:TonB-dependent receptor [Gemmatimonadaceae bacterium]